MKNFLKSLTLFLVGFSLFTSCSDVEKDVYMDDALLNFNKGTTKAGNVQIGSNSNDITVSYGTIKAVEGTHNVELVFDAANSTATLGTTFQIIKGNDEISSGEVGGDFVIRVLETGVSQTPLVAKFKLKSNTLSNAIFDQELTMNMSIVCPVSYFLGTTGVFTYAGFWQGSGAYEIQEVPGQDKTMRIIDYPEVGTNFEFKYDDEGIVSFAEQNTTYQYPSAPYAGQYAWILPISANPSTIDLCARKLTLNVNFVLKPANVGWLNKQEIFTGM